MEPREIGRAYDQITGRWTGDGFDMRNGISAHKRAVEFVEGRGSALDVGCGCTGRFIDLLLKEGFAPEGVDVSSEMIALARQKHPQVPFYNQDICESAPAGSYDFITAWDSIWHVPLDLQVSVITRLVSCLNTGGVFIFSFGGTEEAGEHRNKVMGPEVYYSSLGTNGFLRLILDLGCICRHLEYDQYPELHTYLIVQKM
ncbi:MAG: class I SAM-dependent methyltransferase [Halioglobus sp.]